MARISRNQTYSGFNPDRDSDILNTSRDEIFTVWMKSGSPMRSSRVKLEALKKDFFDYIDKNIDKIDDNVPVFYGHVIATLEKDYSLISMTKLFMTGLSTISRSRFSKRAKRSGDLAFRRETLRLCDAEQAEEDREALYDIMLGMKMINNGKYAEAIEQLKKYRTVDAIICPAIAYCYFVLSTQQPGPIWIDGPARAPSQIVACRPRADDRTRPFKPPVNRLKDMDIAEDPGINKIFWFMIKQAIEWFPSEREFFRIGLEKASNDGKREIREELLSIAIERFYNDMFFLRELYKLKLENRDAGGVAGVVKQMTQQYPDDLEPIYYGLKLSIMTTRVETYYRFRKLAVLKEHPRTCPSPP